MGSTRNPETAAAAPFGPVTANLDRAYLFACRVLGDRALAEDCVQQACLNCLRHPPEDRGPQALGAFFMRTVFRAAVDMRRSEKARSIREEEVGMVERTGASRPEAEAKASAREEALAAREEMERLVPDLRAAVCLCCEEGFTQREAAEILGVPASTVNDRVQKGLERLRSALSARGFAASAPAALAAALGGLGLPPAPAELVEEIGKLAAGHGPTPSGTTPTASVAKGGLLVKIGLGVAALGLAAGTVFLAAGGRSGEPAAGTSPSSQAAGNWRNEQWMVEDFTKAMGGGPAWGPAAGVGGEVEAMAFDDKGNLFLVAGRGNDSDGEQFVDIVTPDGVRRHLAGSGPLGYRDGPAEVAEFRMGVGSYYDFTNIGADDRGNVFVPDNGNQCVRRIFKSADGKWTVETYAGRGEKELKAGESCAPREAKINGNLHVAVAPDGTVTIGGTRQAWRVTSDAAKITCLGNWPDSVGVYGGKPVPAGKSAVMNHCGGGCDKFGNAYFGARSNDVVCRVDKDGKIEHVGGPGAKGHGGCAGDGPPREVWVNTPSSFFVDPSGACYYLCGGDEYDIRRFPMDPKDTTATLLKDGRWHIMTAHPNGNRGKAEFDPAATGKPKTEGGTLTNLVVTPLVGIDREGNLYGKMNRWSGMTIDVAGRGLLGTRVYKIRRVK